MPHQSHPKNTTAAAPPKKKVLRELREMFWGHPDGNQLLYR